MDIKSTGIAIKSNVPRMIDNGNDQGCPMVSTSGTGPSVGPAGLSVTERPAPGSTGPGVGNARRLNSDDAPVGPRYPYGG
jgi:hypothetical protein